jgi:S-adenosylmethionine synthetase
MQRTAEAVSVGHPDKTADYISSYILDRLIEQDSNVRYAVEVMLKDNTVVLGGEITGRFDSFKPETFVKQALREIGYDERYADIWGDKAIDVNQIKVINLVGKQSSEIGQGILQNGWGDQGVFVGYACQGKGLINSELYLARKLNFALYQKARQSQNLGLDIKTQITLAEDGHIETAIVAIPMLKSEDLTSFIYQTLGQKPKNIIVNGTGIYQMHSSIADCGITGRKLACDFYSTASPIGGGCPWTKDGSKADLTLNLLARQLAVENLSLNDECFVYLSSCIGRSELMGCCVKTVLDGKITTKNMVCQYDPRQLIKLFSLDKPIYTKLCLNGITQTILTMNTI